MRCSGLYLILLVLLFSGASVKGQEKSQWIFADGYISDIQRAMFDSIDNPWVTDNVIHNRLNLEMAPSGPFRAVVQVRNRLIYGSSVMASPVYAENTGADNSFLDLSFNWAHGDSYVLNSTIDRAFLELTFDKLEVVAGRQRINWSNTFVWNPNDLFNTYSYFEVDYPERPGCDAVSVKYYPSYSSQLEGAVSADSAGKVTAALFGRFNVRNMDVQVIGGMLKGEDYVLGAGWVTDIAGLSFRGEGSWFHPMENFNDTSAKVILSAGLDYTFSNSVMLQTEWLYCNNPMDISNGFYSLYEGMMDVRALAWSEWSGFAAISYPFNPIINGSLAGMWYPDLKGWFMGPSVELSVADNFNFSLIWQYFNTNAMPTGAGMAQDFRLNMLFLRMKYNF